MSLSINPPFQTNRIGPDQPILIPCLAQNWLFLAQKAPVLWPEIERQDNS